MKGKYAAIGFADAIIDLGTYWHFAVISWGETPQSLTRHLRCKHGGHVPWLAVDVVLDDSIDQAEFLNDVRNAGLRAIVDAAFIHIDARELRT
jgi:hypothetical protein